MITTADDHTHPVGSATNVNESMYVQFQDAALDGAVQATLVTTVEIDDAPRPAAVIESIVRYVR
jgi:hypothetical protein